MMRASLNEHPQAEEVTEDEGHMSKRTVAKKRVETIRSKPHPELVIDPDTASFVVFTCRNIVAKTAAMHEKLAVPGSSGNPRYHADVATVLRLTAETIDEVYPALERSGFKV